MVPIIIKLELDFFVGQMWVELNNAIPNEVSDGSLIGVAKYEFNCSCGNKISIETEKNEDKNIGYSIFPGQTANPCEELLERFETDIQTIGLGAYSTLLGAVVKDLGVYILNRRRQIELAYSIPIPLRY